MNKLYMTVLQLIVAVIFVFNTGPAYGLPPYDGGGYDGYASLKSQFQWARTISLTKSNEEQDPLEEDICEKVDLYINESIYELNFPDIICLSQGKIKEDDPPTVSLRFAAIYINIAMQISEFILDMEMKEEFREYAKIGLDSLMKMQQESGVFPAPDVRHTGSEFGRYQERLVENGLAVAEDGWVVEDLGFGGFQHDLGIIGPVFIKGYLFFGDEKYLQTARNAANWLKQCPVVENWNYNASGAHLLAALYSIDKEQWMLDFLQNKLEEGVLPYQLNSGKWADDHNSRLVYHHIILRALISCYKQWPHEDNFKNRVKAAIEKAVGYVIDCHEDQGISKPWQTVDNFIDAETIIEFRDAENRVFLSNVGKVISDKDFMNLFASIKYWIHQCSD